MQQFTGSWRFLAGIGTGVLLVAASTAGVLAASATISGFAYHPNPITVTAGRSVTWTNNDSAPHTVTADDGSFTSGTIASGGTFTHTFATMGTVAYHCTIHQSMHGSVDVQAAPAPTPTPTPRHTNAPRPTASVTPPPADTNPVLASGESRSLRDAAVLFVAVAVVATFAMARIAKHR